MSFGTSPSFLLVCFAFTVVISGQRIENVTNSNRPNETVKHTIMSQLKPYIEMIRNMFQAGILQKLVKYGVLQTLSSANVTSPCLGDTGKLVQDLLSREDYALQFLDADAKIPPGILQGERQWFGDYEQCKAIESPYNAITGHRFRGQYSNVMLDSEGNTTFEEAFPLIIGICLPDSCIKSDVHTIASIVAAPLSEFSITVSSIEMDEDYPYGGVEIAFFIISAVLVLLVILGTLFDSLYEPLLINKNIKEAGNVAVSVPTLPDSKTEKPTVIPTVCDGTTKQDAEVAKADMNGTVLNGDIKGNNRDYVMRSTDKTFILKCLISFSIISNTKKLLNMSTAKGPLACLNGIRVLSMWWVIQGHTYSIAAMVLDNVLYARKVLSGRFSSQVIYHASFSVDSFFFLSGLLVTYLALKEWKKRGRINWVYYFAHRYWRLTPLYAFLLMFNTGFLYTHMVSGPLKWMLASPRGVAYPGLHACKSYWWTNLLYVNNLYPKDVDTGVCMGWGWYLANDMQFYVIVAPILLILLYKIRVIGLVVSVATVVACVVTRGVLVSYYKILEVDGPSTVHTDDEWGTNALYINPWTRVSVYVVGMLTGYILYSKKIRLNRLVSVIGWVVSIATSLSLIYGLYYQNKHEGGRLSLTASWFYNAFDRTAWSLCLAWVTIACTSGYGGWVNSILSWKIWAPLGRLTYSAYLVHPFVIVIWDFSSTAPLHFTDMSLVSMFVGYLVLSYGCAYVVSMVAEAPMMQLEKCILKGD